MRDPDAAHSVDAACVSVVVPVYNGACHLLQTLQAVGRQTHSHIDLIVVDDQSSDSSAAVARGCGVPLRLLSQKNAGVSAARNAGLQAARGDFVCFLDQDDIWHPQHLARQLAVFQAQPETGAVVSPYQHWHPRSADDGVDQALFGSAADDGLDPDFSGWVYHQFMLDCWALTSATMLRRSAVQAVGGFDENLPFSEDWDLWLRLSREVPFAKLRWPRVLYRQHSVQGSRRARPVDYRCRLLLATAERHGLASRDGRRIERALFDATIARYQADFGYHQLGHGDRGLAVRSLWQAWRRRPAAVRVLAQAAAGCLGWRPATHDERLAGQWTDAKS
jgi:glycosyltransferase involved in cell wall biosynthesis